MLTSITFLVGCAAAPSEPIELSKLPRSRERSSAAVAPLPPLAGTLVAASSELDEALRAPQPVRSQRVARARGVIESLMGRPAELVAAKKLGHDACALGPTLLAVGSPKGMTSTRGGHFVEFGDALLRFDPEMRVVAPAAPQAGTDDALDLDPARFVWTFGTKGRLVDLEKNAVVVEGDPESILFRSRSGRLRVVGFATDATELRTVPGGKVLFRLDGGEPFADEVAGVAGAVKGWLEDVPSWLAVHDAETGRELGRFSNVPSSMGGLHSVAVARDGRTVALQAGGRVAWLDTRGRRVERSVTGGSSFEGTPRGPFFTADSKRACADYLGEAIVLPVDVPRSDRTVCAFTPPGGRREAVLVTVKPDPPWRILRGRAQVIGNFTHTLGASAASSDGTRVAVIEVDEPPSQEGANGRLRLVGAKTGTTLRVWPLSEGGALSDVEMRFVEGDSAIIIKRGSDDVRRFVVDERAVADRPAPVEMAGANAACTPPAAWSPSEKATCRIGPVMGPAALCEGLTP
jgi:hypothetical protein